MYIISKYIYNSTLPLSVSLVCASTYDEIEPLRGRGHFCEVSDILQVYYLIETNIL